MNPAIVAPDGFDIIDMTAGGQVHSEQRRNLASVAKMLQHAAANKLFEDESDHLTPMNSYISQTYQRFRWGEQSTCPGSQTINTIPAGKNQKRIGIVHL